MSHSLGCMFTAFCCWCCRFCHSYSCYWFGVGVVCYGVSGGLWWPWWFRGRDIRDIRDWRRVRRVWRRRIGVNDLDGDRLAHLVVNDAVDERVVPSAYDLAELLEAVGAQVAPVLQGGEPLV